MGIFQDLSINLRCNNRINEVSFKFVPGLKYLPILLARIEDISNSTILGINVVFYG